MRLTRMSSKGQVVIPCDLRAAHAWKPGLEFEDVAACVLLWPQPPLARTSIADVVGCTGYVGPRRSLAGMRSAVPPDQVDEP